MNEENRFICPCCGFRTLEEPPPGTFRICPICFWEDDDIQYEEPDYAGGANDVSLTQARNNFRDFGACELRLREYTREPNKAEIIEKLSRISGTSVDIETQITLISPEDGGRKGPFFCGMHPQFYYDDRDWDCTLQILDDQILAQGQTIAAFFGMSTPSSHIGKLAPGKEFSLRDGHKIIAQGRVTAIWSLERPK